MMRNIYLIVLSVLIASCVSKENENAFRLAVIYCDCVKAKSSQLPKTIVSTKDCEDLALGNSRLINILLADDKSIYNRQTLDSANKLLNEFSNITDTMCLNGIDKKRLK